MDLEGSSSFYVIDKQTSSHIVWRCTYKSCSGRLKVNRKDNKVTSSKPHNHVVEPRTTPATNEIENIFCLKMNKYILVVVVAIALLVGALVGGVVAHYCTLYKLGYYEESYDNDHLSRTMAMMKDDNMMMAHDGINNDFNNQNLINQDDVPQDTFPINLFNMDDMFHNTNHQNELKQNNRNSLELLNANFNSHNPQNNLNNNNNFHNQGNNNNNENAFQNRGFDPRQPNEFQQESNSNAFQNQINQLLNEDQHLQGDRSNAGTHHNTHSSQNHRFQLNGGIQNQGDHSQHQQNIQRNIHRQHQQTQQFNQNNFHRNVNQNIHQGQHLNGHSVNRGPNQQAPRNVNTPNFNNQQFLPTNTNPSFQSSFTLQSMSMIKEEDHAGISSTTTSKTPTNTQIAGIPLSANSKQIKEQTSLRGSDISIVKAATVSINMEGLTNFNEESSKSQNAFPINNADITTLTEKIMVESPVIFENKDILESSDVHTIKDSTGPASQSKQNIGLNDNLSQNHSEMFSKALNPNTDFSNVKSIATETEKLNHASDINIEGVNINDGFPIRKNPNPVMNAPFNDDNPLSVNKKMNLNTNTSPINNEGISMVSEGLFMAIEGLSMIDREIDPHNIDLHNTIVKMQDAISNINLLPSLNISHRFSHDELPHSHGSKDISLSFVKSPAVFPTSTLNNDASNGFSPDVLPKSHDNKDISLSFVKSPAVFPTSTINNDASNGFSIDSLPTSSGSKDISLSFVKSPAVFPTSTINNGASNGFPPDALPTSHNNKDISLSFVKSPAVFPTSTINDNTPLEQMIILVSKSNHQLIPSPVSHSVQGSNIKHHAPNPVSLPTRVSNPRQLVPTPLSPPIQRANTKQLNPTPLSPPIQGTNTKELVPTPVSPPTQRSNTNIPVSNPVSTPLGVPPMLVPIPISSPNKVLASQFNPTQDHQPAQQQPLMSNIQENIRIQSVRGSHSENPNRSNSVSFDMEEIRNYILKTVSKENLRNNLRELSRLPHQAGSAREEQLANFIKARFLSSGFDMAELVPYDVLLSKPDPTQNNRVSLHTEGGVGEEVWAAQSLILPNENLQAYTAYSPSGKVMTIKGEAVVYVNYGRAEDFEYLDSIGVSVSGRVVMARTVIYVSGMKLVQQAANRGARGVILYADPSEVVNPGDTSVYPNSTSLPGDAVQLRTIRSGQGDPLTPGWPSKSYSHRLLEEDLKSLPSIPVQPISYNDARKILRKLGGPASPAAWHGGLTDVSYNIGPTMTSDFAHLNLCLATYNQLNRTTIYNVIGTIRGEVEPDRYVILGNHRDAWAYGAIDPSSGTSQMLETAAVLGQLKAKGWRPRRTIVFASWGAEEFGKIGSTEWVEEHVGKLKERGVAYINVDICSTGPILAHSASPSMRDVLVDMAKLVPGIGSGGTIYDEWREYSLRVDKTEPKPWHLGTGTDFSAFSFFSGVPSLGMGFMRNSTDNDVPMYPAYHTGIETFHLVDTFIDPGFNIHQGCSRLSALTLAHLAESPVLPLDPHYQAMTMEEALIEMKRKGLHDVLMGTLGVQTLPALEESILSFKMAANSFLIRIKNPNYHKDPMILRGVNDQLTRLEQNFLMPQGSDDKPWCRQAVFAPSPGSAFGKWGFPALKDLLVGLKNLHGTELSQRHHLIEKHVSDLILMTNNAISSLNHLHVI